MYVGRIVCVSVTGDGRVCGSYRVSSRSFPNRTAVVGTDKVSIVPKAGFEGDVQRNPYIAYNCVRLVCGGEVAVVTNGSQTDAVAEKIDAGMGVRDALVLASMALDYEKDDYNTPRVSAVVDRRDGAGWLGVVRVDGLQVERMPMEAGRYFYVATYEECSVSVEQGGVYDAGSAVEGCGFVLAGGVFAERTNAVTGVAAMARAEGGFELAAVDAEGA